MSKTSTALLIKFVITLVVTWIAFSLLGASTFTSILIVSIVATLISYVIGDLIVLRSFGNTIASIGDGFLAMFTAYLIGLFTYGFRATGTGYIVFGVIIAVAEYFFHKYLLNNREVAPNSDANLFQSNRASFNMEAGEDFDIDNIGNKNSTDDKIDNAIRNGIYSGIYTGINNVTPSDSDEDEINR
ncbi:DUF2512 family protein [Clostridium cylindrosporum]|uniref:DUF2512 family protein n=1 Tax=Clostridium cylindrosporum DSM 605 TaxID=1121307 RepID=A0A0J8D792_CLOCY|nr:DUF2512 family protein [Clostridium cylindrosporum]KMT21935.1 hypothetical protein CLCY_3c02060 [Clostridium cylindrosporum DSM 605]